MVIPKKFRSVFKKTSFMPLGWGGMALLTSACSQSGTSHMDQRGNNSFTPLTHACDQLKRLSVDEEENSKDGVFKYPFISGVTTRSRKRSHNGLIKPAKQELLFSRNRCNFIFSTVARDIKKRKKGKDIKKFLTEMCGSKENIKNVINTVKNKKGKTLLHKAAKYDHIDVIKLLLELGADINARDNKLSTPLHKAIKKRNINTIKELLYNGPHMYPENNRETPRDTEGNTLWALAKRVGDLQLIQLLDHIHINNEGKNYINKRKRES